MSEQLGQEAAAAAIAQAQAAQSAKAEQPNQNTDAPVSVPSNAVVPDQTSADAAAGNALDKQEAKSDGQEPLAKTGNDALDAGIEMMQKVAGLSAADVSRIFSKAEASGDLSHIDKEFIKDRFPEHASYIEKLANLYVEHQTTSVNKIVSDVHTKAGGTERWGLLNQTFQQNAPQALQSAVKALGDAGDFAGAADLVIQFSESSGLVPVENGMLKGGAASDGALSAKDFATELSKLRAAFPNRSLESGKAAAQYKSLVQRRALGKSKNL